MATPAENARARRKRWRDKNPTYGANHYKRYKDTQRNSFFKRKYGLTLKQRDELLALQGGRCAICLSTESGGKGWHIDHCHNTQKVRGILCHYCNVGLGNLRDDPTIVHSAYRYLICNTL